MEWKSTGRGGTLVDNEEKKEDGATCCLTLPLKLEKWQSDHLEKRFEIARQLYNTLVHAELKRIHRIERMPEYREIERQIEATTDKKEKWALKNQKKQFLRKNGINRNTFTTDMKRLYKHFNDNIGSNVAQHGIVSQVLTAFEKVYIENQSGEVHFKKPGDLRSVQGYSQKKSGGVEIMFREGKIIWNQQGNNDRKGVAREFPLKLSPDNSYEAEMLKKHVKFVRILRNEGKTKPHWYAQLVLEGKPAIKRDPASGAPKHPVGHGVVGIDIGTRTLAYSTDSKVDLIELADRVQNTEQEKMLLQRKLDRSRRATNPENYKPDGTIKKGVKLTRNKSKRYRKIQHQLAMLQHRQADIRKRQHNELANYLLTLGDCFFVEDMDYRALTRKAKKTEISEKTGRYKRKKRFGKSIANKAPSMLIALLDQKCKSLNLEGVKKVDTAVKASQYNHQTDECKAKELKERWNIMPDGERIQRDLYSAFLLQHCRRDLPEYNRKKLQEAFGNEVYRVFDREALQRDYPKFVEYHRETIQRLSALPKTIASMGIRRIIS
jgi:hypothetical protein